MRCGGGCIVEVDIRKFFDTLDHGHLREFLQRRVRDGVLLRLIGKWLNAGVLEEGTLSYPESGSPQGGVISPLLANVYLHYVLDEWFEQEVKPRLRGQAFLIRYADDFVIGFTDESDAQRVLAVLGKRFAKYGLALHPDKTRLLRFQRPAWGGGKASGKPETFDLLGFTVYWGRTLRGGWAVKTRTAASRFRRAIRTIHVWCRDHRHQPIPEQRVALMRKLLGHYAYYGRPGNYDALARFFRLVTKTWHMWLSRRSWKSYLSWPKFNRLLERHPLPRPRIRASASVAGKALA
jgi:group II intron reverse transcriptase/maturase